jgi:hypothetical protein
MVRTYENIRYKLTTNSKDVNCLFMKCYHCNAKGHIAIHCPFFEEVKGNLNRKYNRPKVDAEEIEFQRL